MGVPTKLGTGREQQLEARLNAIIAYAAALLFGICLFSLSGGLGRLFIIEFASRVS
jgi:hypothetical protein